MNYETLFFDLFFSALGFAFGFRGGALYFKSKIKKELRNKLHENYN